LSFATKIALLQQTSTEDDDSTTAPAESLSESALQYILDHDIVRNEIEAELNGEQE
jgi:hypothetical protein